MEPQPDWFHPAGTKIKFALGNNGGIALNSNAANVSILKRGDHWLLRYEIRHSEPDSFGIRQFDGNSTFDQVELSTEELSSAFFLEAGEMKSFIQGKFVRSGRFLNLPGPGTGRAGDHTLSVYVSEDIQAWVRKLINQEIIGNALG